MPQTLDRIVEGIGRIEREIRRSKQDGLFKVIKKQILFGLALTAAFPVLNIYFNNNVKEETEERVILKKADLFSSTTLILEKQYPIILIGKNELSRSKTYISVDGKKVDEFSVHYHPIMRKRDLTLRRDNKKQYEFYKAEFDKADKEYLEQFKRFNIERDR